MNAGVSCSFTWWNCTFSLGGYVALVEWREIGGAVAKDIHLFGG